MSKIKRAVVGALLAAIVALVGVHVPADDGQTPTPVAPIVTVSPTPASPVPSVAPKSDLASDLRAEPAVPGKASGAARTNELAQQQAIARKGFRSNAPPVNCRVDYTGHVYSDRAVARPTMFVLHYTVSANRPGWSDVYAIRDYFKRTRVGSAHYILDFEGHCLKMVPLKRKAWTQGNANSWADSVEIIATGRESRDQWKQAPIFAQKKLAALVRRTMDYHGIRVKLVDPVGCVFPSGWTDHARLECGNFHTDVLPNFPYGKLGTQLHSYDRGA